MYIGLSDVATTFNVYGHLLPGDEAGATAQLDAFLGATSTTTLKLWKKPDDHTPR